MIVKILSSTASFSGVSYNTDKIEQGKGELVNVSNFGMLQMLSELRPTDYINYFKAVSSVNKRVSKPQFHAVISAKGRSTLKEELTRIAQNWLLKMGYGKNPYLIVFHSDTKNNHVHTVSTRIDKAGKKISSAYEKLRAIRLLSETLGQNTKPDIRTITDKMLKYRFSTLAQLKLLFEIKGFSTSIENDKLKISGQEGQISEIDLVQIDKIIATDKRNIQRSAQLRGIIEKYKPKYSFLIQDLEKSDSKALHSGMRYGSDLGDFLHSKFGIQLVFHYSGEYPPYGYTIIDHAEKNVFKGSEIIKLKTLIGETSDNQPSTDTFQNYNIKNIPKIKDNIDSMEFSDFDRSVLNLPDLTEDIDDEAILGRNRQRKGKARTNTR
ncbi:relaxase/mobilization nuclease domain-containing protein [Pedobacter sp. R-06]|uniref:relaxase/mobilization nuclease domain-containing protein n=1 Tax=Pedobacter sp. R-06 TaxID=3404051 RepID=UPI003CEBE33B